MTSILNKNIIVLFFIFTIINCANAQSLSNLKQKTIVITEDTVKIDDLSIIPESVKLFSIQNETINKADYKILYNDALIVRLNKNLSDSLIITYRTLPSLFYQTYSFRDSSKFFRYETKSRNPFVYKDENLENATFDFGGLKYNGSFGRDISVGNNQNLVLNSNFNLQFAGRLKNDVEVLAAISDQSIPIQPEGNTALLQEFDRIFIQFKKGGSDVIFGDFELRQSENYFLRYLKKLQGISASNVSKLNEKLTNTTNVSLAIAKGKFFRTTILTEEGNQGPYKLKGENNEIFIIVLSGTERVFVDGKKLERGANNDYIIDYNTGEIQFTHNQLVTQDVRITIEYEYAVQQFQRTLTAFSNEIKNDKFRIKANYYNEQDSKNQPLSGPFSANQLDILNEVGNNIDDAIVNGFAAVNFNSENVQYEMKDTFVNGNLIDSVFVYSTDSTKNLFAASFSNVGVGNGNYVISESLANNRVYKWIKADSLTGNLQGEFAPIIRIVAPLKRQQVNLETEFNINKKNKIWADVAFSNLDPNTLSEKNNDVNKGIATRFAWENKIDLSKNKNKSLTNEISFENKSKLFKAIERYRPVEFSRYWNLKTPNDTIAENWLQLKTTYEQSDNFAFGFTYDLFNRTNIFNGNKYGINTRFRKNGFFINANSNLLTTSNNNASTSFVIQNYQIEKSFKSKHKIGFKFLQEDNKININQDSLSIESFKFDNYNAYFSNSDTGRFYYNLGYINRVNFKPKNNLLLNFDRANTFTLSGFLRDKKRKHSLNYNVNYRALIVDDSLSSSANNKTILSFTEYGFKALKDALRSSTIFEVNSGQQQKIEYTYAEVQPGNGQFVWTDYNNNTIREDNEFEIAAFADSARYIRILVPTDQYFKTNAVNFREAILFDAKKIITKTKGLAGFVAKFQYQGNFQIQRKTQAENFEIKTLFPFYSIEDSTLVTLQNSVRNTLAFNRNSSKFASEVYAFSSKLKTALISGFDGRNRDEVGINFRYNINKIVSLKLSSVKELLENNSDTFTNRVYKIEGYNVEPEINLLFNRKFRASAKYRFKSSENIIETGNNEKAIQNKINLEMRYNIISKSSLSANFSYDLISYTGENNTSLSYTMLQALQPGNNFVWNLRIDKTFKNNLSLAFSYNGRKLGVQNITHTGTANLRALF